MNNSLETSPIAWMHGLERPMLRYEMDLRASPRYINSPINSHRGRRRPSHDPPRSKQMPYCVVCVCKLSWPRATGDEW
jgi:hypothetical protein